MGKILLGSWNHEILLSTITMTLSVTDFPLAYTLEQWWLSGSSGAWVNKTHAKE